MNNNINECYYCKCKGELVVRSLNGKPMCSDCIQKLHKKNHIEILKKDDFKLVEIPFEVSTYDFNFRKVTTNIGFLILDKYFVARPVIESLIKAFPTMIFHNSIEDTKCGFHECDVYDINTFNDKSYTVLRELNDFKVGEYPVTGIYYLVY